MDLTPFKLDIDELINEFTESNSTTLADMKGVWLSRKFTFIYEAKPANKLGFFMQSLYAHSISHLVSTDSLSRRLGALYCLYYLYETQPFKPPFKIYISLGELKRLKILVVDAKQSDIRVVPALVKRMLERNMFLFGSVDVVDGSERAKEIAKLQNRRLQLLHEKLLANTRIEEFLNMDMGLELDLKGLKKISTEYAKAKEQTFKEASELVEIDDIKHIAGKKSLIGDTVEKISEEWNLQKEAFHDQTGYYPAKEEAEAGDFDKELENLLTDK